MNKIERSFGTHDGTFHADEVTACALLLLFDLIDEDKVFRTRDPEILQRCEYICDVGGIYDPARRLFDHHQVDYQGTLSSAGMILLYLKNRGVVSEDQYRYLNQSLVVGVDAHDNGKAPPLSGFCSFSNLVSNFTPVEYDISPEEQNNAFFEAVHFVLGHLRRLLQRLKYQQSCRQAVQERMKQGKDFLLFEKGMPWLESFFDLGGESHPALFVVMPSGKHWKLRGIPPTYEERMKVRLPLPAEWAGLLEDDLRRVSGIPGAIFCHKERFISVWETREDALKALEMIMNVEATPMSTIFGDIIAGKIPSEKVFENDRILAIKDINPAAPIHILIMPKKEIPSLQEASSDDLALLPEIFSVAQQLAEKFGVSDGYRLLVNNGALAGQTVFHLHFHLIGGRRLGAMA